MLTDKIIEAVKNTRSTKYFILLDDLDMRYRVVNPMGETLIVPANLFDIDVVAVSTDQFSDFFTPEQLATFTKHLERQAAEAERERLIRAMPPPPPRTVVAPPAPAPRSRSSSPRPKEKPGTRTGLAATWTSDRLTFYRHKIEPLHPKQSFKIIVTNQGEFEFTKDDFNKHFNDAAMSLTYRQEGLFAYPELPEKAQKYKK
jgi:hypothetical protein